MGQDIKHGRSNQPLESLYFRPEKDHSWQAFDHRVDLFVEHVC